MSQVRRCIATQGRYKLNKGIFRCEASPKNLDGNFNETRRQGHERTDFIIKCFDLGIVWEKYGIRSDVVICIFNLPKVIKISAVYSWISAC